MRSNGHKMRYRNSHLNMEKSFFTSRVTEHWHGLHREVVKSPSLENIQNPPGHDPVQGALDDPAWQGGFCDSSTDNASHQPHKSI